MTFTTWKFTRLKMENCLEQFIYFGFSFYFFYFWIAGKCVTLHYIKSLKWHKFSFYVVVIFLCLWMSIDQEWKEVLKQSDFISFFFLFFFFMSYVIIFKDNVFNNFLYVKLFSFIENNFCNIKNTLNNK